ncbi:putative amidohydrolase [Rhizobium sp. BK529]|uniref:carbon-nitrogen hydrolase family protein n=1 Tax=unclassified Rhizobium TaxID=2613769 RepID=UPI00104795CF|nr:MULTISPECIES: carbon-nitrogen hydrolase family protein [unclassified Rhizobium]MBB3594269.1 putative amidohydrolase [Rhizobium sp. BK529]TCS02062.1 putative amidohydrolase [Rhizobium sp. BK418]
MSFTAAAIQMCSGVDPERNAASMARLVREAAAKGATYVQTPEMTGMLQRNRAAAKEVLRDESNDIIVKTGSALAAELAIYMHIGSTAIALDDGKMANRGFLFGPDGKILNRYDKIHMFDVDLDNGESWRESAAYRAGSEARVLSLPFAEMGFTICYDVRFPQLFRAQAVAGAEVITVPAAFTKQTGEAHWEILLRARAIENGVFVIAAAQAGLHEDGRETFGHSMIIDPWGKVLASAGPTDEAVILAEIDLAAVKAAHDKIPNLKNGREFSIERIAGEVSGGAAA